MSTMSHNPRGVRGLPSGTRRLQVPGGGVVATHKWTMDQYLSYDAINAGMIHTALNDSAKHANRPPEHPRATSKSLSFGTLEHMAVLEPSRVEESYLIWESEYKGGEVVGARWSEKKGEWTGGKVKAPGQARPKSGQAWDDFESLAGSKGRTICTDKEMDRALEVAKIAREAKSTSDQRRSAEILADPTLQTEVSITFKHPITGAECKIRADGMTDTLGFDLKCWERPVMRPAQLWKQAHNLGYETKSALYSDGIEVETGRRRDFALMFVQVVWPFEVAVLIAGPDYLEAGRRNCVAGIQLIQSCRESGYWPGAMTGEFFMKRPRYADSDFEESGDGDVVINTGGQAAWE